MASSNKHWPSMFKKSSKTSNHLNWQHGINSSLLSTAFQRTPTSGAGDERSPEPKPRWNPKPEQIRILEAIFNSGMVNPPREEIRKIRAQLQEYGQVGDANVFYWFQNRKSRSKHKLRHLHNSKTNKNKNPESSNSSNSLPQITAPPSSSSSDKKANNEFSNIGFSNGVVVSNSPTTTTSVDQNQASGFFQTPFYNFPVENNNNDGMTTQGFYLPEFSNIIHHQDLPQQNVVPLVNDQIMIMNFANENRNGTSSSMKDQQGQDIQDPQLSFCDTSASSTEDPTLVPHIPITNAADVTVPPSITDQLQGVGEEADGRAKCTVIINDVVFEVDVGPFNVREAFGDGAVLFDSTGHPILTDDWGVTLHSLHHGASYYLI
uniref:WUSCHEL-related homeobox 9-like isoform X2 n=1 Tax=Cicer arietinum TaxID=3827 RepID=A0A1S2YJD3_CICAR|nr:WUSCHEL-related homeobox 9-like isoform X2 [Cicer arietinum]